MSTSNQESVNDVPIRRAASVLLLREAANGFEVFVQQRVSTMDFAAGMVVYPGGRVDAHDTQVASSQELDESLLAAHAHRWEHTSVHDLDTEQAAFRAAEVLAAARREVFEETGLMLDPAQLHPWANWVTPPGRSRRFDTFFFVAALTEDQQPRHQTTEAVTSLWMNPTDIFAAIDRDELKMMRPTRRTLLDAMEQGSVQAIITSEPEIISVHPDPQNAETAVAVSASEQRANQPGL